MGGLMQQQRNGKTGQVITLSSVIVKKGPKAQAPHLHYLYSYC